MASYSVAEAKNRFSSLLDAAERGEKIEITRYGRPVAILAAAPAPKPSQLESLERVWREIDRLDMPQLDCTRMIREMRDEDWG